MRRTIVMGAVFWGCLANCAPSPKASSAPAGKPSSGIVLRTEPPQGAYEDFPLEVSVASAFPVDLFYAIGGPPEIVDKPDSRDFFKVTLNSSARIHVVARDANGELFGPYIFEFIRILEVPNFGACSISSASRYYRPDQDVEISVEYQSPAPLARIELEFDGVITRLPVDDLVGVYPVNLGKITTEGLHTLACHIVSNLESVHGAHEFVIDGTPPAVNWISDGGVFGRDNWHGEFQATVTDTLSGLHDVSVCNALAICLPMPLAPGGGFRYATAVTVGTSVSQVLSIEAFDRAGNRAVSEPLSIQLNGFENETPSEPIAIALAPTTTVDLSAFRAIADVEPVSEVRRLGSAEPLLAGALALQGGWNDFVFRTDANREWRSFGVYRAGAAITVPAQSESASWLVYGSAGTAAGFQADRLEQFTLAAETTEVWRHDGFAPLQFLFVLDRNSNGDWDDGDELWLPAAAHLTQGTIALEKVGEPAAGSAIAISVACTDCPSPGVLYFERRPALFEAPQLRSRLATSLPFDFEPFAVPEEVCLFFWDQNADSVLNGNERRDWGPCMQGSFTLTEAPPLALADTPEGVVATGVPYGGVATATAMLRIGGELIYRRPLPELRDVNGAGSSVVRGLLPELGETVVFFAGGQEVELATTPIEPTGGAVLDIYVTDENGNALAAEVIVGNLENGVNRRFDPAAIPGIPVPAAESWLGLPRRDGYLSRLGQSVGTTLKLRLFSAALHARGEGRVQDEAGQPIENAKVVWDADPYWATTYSGEDGRYALPVSGWGNLRVTAPGRALPDDTFWLDGAAGFTRDITIPADPDVSAMPLWPRGILGEDRPESFSGPGLANLVFSEVWYAAAATGGPAAGVWELLLESGISRSVVMPGALPGSNPGANTIIVPVFEGIESELRCGDRRQSLGIRFTSVLDDPCWAWVGDDGLQQFFFGFLDPQVSFPPEAGLARLSLLVYDGNMPAMQQTLVAEELLLGRKLKVAIQTGGIVDAFLPRGVYRLSTADGRATANSNGDPRTFDLGETPVPQQLLFIITE